QRFDDPACQSRLTRGQRMLFSLSAFDGQVKNGGITQFFWNCPDLIFEVGDSLKALELTELSGLYDRGVDTLIGKKEDWAQLRNKAYRDPQNPDWQSFQKSYDLLDLSWFEDDYYDRWGRDSQGR